MASHTLGLAIARDGPSMTALWRLISRVERLPLCSSGSNVLSLAFFGFVVLGLAWLGMSIRSLNKLLRRSRPVAQAQLLNLLRSLKSNMGVNRTVELRVSSEVATAATVGWRKPILLLSNGWASWSDAELRAVLAHELAHVLRADYATWLMANVSVAVNFYHPFMYWLANRLKLQQELAADAMGALHAGGADVYRRSLARLVLRQDCSPLPGPARAFLPAQGTLMRRIAMLRDMDVASHIRSSWKVRLGLPACLASSHWACRPCAAAQQDTPLKRWQVSCLDRILPGLCASRCRRVVSLRPAEIIGRPEIKQLLSQYGKQVE